jgi:hypothetical protein
MKKIDGLALSNSRPLLPAYRKLEGEEAANVASRMRRAFARLRDQAIGG